MPDPTFTYSTRVLANVTTVPALAETDATQRSLVIFFDTENNAYYGYIITFTDVNTVTLADGSGLPTEDKTLQNIVVINTGAAHTYQHYLDEIASLIKDEDAKLDSDDLDLILAKAISDWGKDRPLIVSKKVTGNNTSSYVLSAVFSGLWKHGYSKILSIEYPYGSNPPEMLGRDDWNIYDDGTEQDGTNQVLKFIDASPTTSEYFIAKIIIEPIFSSVGSQNYPDTNENFSAITTLAAVYSCQRLATAYAQNKDATIDADSVNYNDKSSKYTTLAKEYLKRYNKLIFGQEDPQSDTQPGLSKKELRPVSKSSPNHTRMLFHDRR